MANHTGFMKAAVALGVRSGRGVAILARPATPAAQAKLGSHANRVPHSAAAALLHREADDLVGHNLYLSYPPTEICLGLAWRAKVKRVCFMSGVDEMTEVDPTAPDNSPLGYASSPVALLGLSAVSQADKANEFLGQLDGGTLLGLAAVEGRPLDDDLRATLARGLALRQPVVAAGADVHEVFMRLVFSLVRWGWNEDLARDLRPGADAPRPFGNNIGGILVSAQNRILAWGLNMKKVNPTFHAETMMIQYYLQREERETLPDGCRLYTSLECCNMCAGHVVSLGRNIQVYYGQKDTNIAPTALSRGVNGCQQQPGANGHVGWLNRSQSDRRFGNAGTIDFLFDKAVANPGLPTEEARPRPGETRQIFQHGAHLNPIRVVPVAPDPRLSGVQNIARTLQVPAPGIGAEADRFLRDLQVAGVLVGMPRG